MLTTRTIAFRQGSVEVVSFSPQKGLGNYRDFSFERPFVVQPFTGLFEAYTPNSDGNQPLWKNFQHFKRAAVIPSGLGPAYHPTVSLTEHGGYSGAWYHLGGHSDPCWGMRGFGPIDNPTLGLSSLYQPNWSGRGEDDFVPDPPDLASLKQRSLTTMLPSMKSELSLLNSLIELKDFKTLPKTLMSTYELLRKTTLWQARVLRAGRKLRYGRSPTLKELVRWGSDNYLQWMFNIRPLISDICGIHKSLTRLEAKVNKLLSASAKPQRRHFATTLSDSSSQTDKYGPYFLDTLHAGVDPDCSGVHTSERTVNVEASQFHSTIEYNFSFTQYQREHAHILTLLDALGVNLNPTIIWNAIPWSFVVDWVIGVNRWLDQFKVANMEPVINVRNYCWSISRTRRITTRYQAGYNTFGMTYSPMVAACSMRETSYKRVVGMPTASSLVTSGLSLTEFSLGAALVLPRHVPHRQRKSRWTS